MDAPIEIKRNLAEQTTKKAILVNTLLMALQFFIGLLAASPALVADSIHTASDLAADFVVLVACRFSVAAPDFDHPYGHHRYETIATLLLGALLILVASAIIWRACNVMFFIQNNTAPAHVSALIVAIAVILLKEGLYRYIIQQAKKLQSTLLTANAWHARSDAAASLIVTIGIAGSIAGYPLLDPAAAIVVGIVIAYTGCRFAWDALQDLSDRALPAEEMNKITEILLSVKGVKATHRVRTRKAGDWILVDAHICVDPKISVSEGHFIAEKAQAKLCKNSKILDAIIHVDPENDLHFGYSGLPNQETLRLETIRMLTKLKCEVSKVDIHYLFNNVTIDVVLLVRIEQLTEIEYRQNLVSALYNDAFVQLAKKLKIKSVNVLLQPVLSKKSSSK